MMKLHRPNPPDWLATKSQSWGLKYETRKSANPDCKFNWPTYRKVRINLHLLPLLIEMTSDHCSFCDGYPMRSFGGNSIEHFKPTSDPQYCRLVCQWENLFLCCYVCQGAKHEKFNDALLKPDEFGYEFNRYFVFDFATGIINPNPASDEAEQTRAKITIELYGLNRFDRPETRKQIFAQSTSIQTSDNDRSSYPYRFMFL